MGQQLMQLHVQTCNVLIYKSMARSHITSPSIVAVQELYGLINAFVYVYNNAVAFSDILKVGDPSSLAHLIMPLCMSNPTL